MRIQWYGQSAFALEGAEHSVFIDPFNMSGLTPRSGMQWPYPPISGVSADLVLITHEHPDHNDPSVIDGSPIVLRSTAGRLASPVGEVLAVASEHDEVAGTQRGPNTIFVFELDGWRIAHFGDFGQSELREEQAVAIGPVDLLFIPVGDGPTIGAEHAAAIARRLRASVVVPMHYGGEKIAFLKPVDAFLERMGAGERLAESAFELPELNRASVRVIVPAAP